MFKQNILIVVASNCIKKVKLLKSTLLSLYEQKLVSIAFRVCDVILKLMCFLLAIFSFLLLASLKRV